MLDLFTFVLLSDCRAPSSFLDSAFAKAGRSLAEEDESSPIGPRHVDVAIFI